MLLYLGSLHDVILFFGALLGVTRSSWINRMCVFIFMKWFWNFRPGESALFSPFVLGPFWPVWMDRLVVSFFFVWHIPLFCRCSSDTNSVLLPWFIFVALLLAANCIVLRVLRDKILENGRWLHQHFSIFKSEYNEQSTHPILIIFATVIIKYYQSPHQKRALEIDDAGRLRELRSVVPIDAFPEDWTIVEKSRFIFDFCVELLWSDRWLPKPLLLSREETMVFLLRYYSSLFFILPSLFAGLSLVLPRTNRELAFYNCFSYFLVVLSSCSTFWQTDTKLPCMI